MCVEMHSPFPKPFPPSPGKLLLWWTPLWEGLGSVEISPDYSLEVLCFSISTKVKASLGEKALQP